MTLDGAVAGHVAIHTAHLRSSAQSAQHRPLQERRPRPRMAQPQALPPPRLLCTSARAPGCSGCCQSGVLGLGARFDRSPLPSLPILLRMATARLKPPPERRPRPGRIEV